MENATITALTAQFPLVEDLMGLFSAAAFREEPCQILSPAVFSWPE